MGLSPEVFGSAPKLFTLKDKGGEAYKFSDIQARYTVLYFYPKDNTPGCTIEAKEFNSLLQDFGKLGVEVVGISGGDEKSKQKFCTKHKLKVLLLSDPDFEVAKEYGAYGEKSFMGGKFKGVLRKTFILDEKKRIIKVYDSVKARGHAEEVLEFVRSLG